MKMKGIVARKYLANQRNTFWSPASRLHCEWQAKAWTPHVSWGCRIFTVAQCIILLTTLRIATAADLTVKVEEQAPPSDFSDAIQKAVKPSAIQVLEAG